MTCTAPPPSAAMLSARLATTQPWPDARVDGRSTGRGRIAPMALMKRVLLGRPLSSAEQEQQRIAKLIGLAVFLCVRVSSTAYATEEILFVTAVGASSLALGLDVLVPIA